MGGNAARLLKIDYNKLTKEEVMKILGKSWGLRRCRRCCFSAGRSALRSRAR